MLAHREFILEGSPEVDFTRGGVPYTEDNRHGEIARGHFTDLEKPVVTWINGKGDLKQPQEYNSTHELGAAFPDAHHVRLRENIDESKGIRQSEMLLQLFPTFSTRP